MRKRLQVLLVEDSEADAFLIESELRRPGYDVVCNRVQTEPAFCTELEKAYDVIIADYRLPHFSADRALQLVQEKHIDIPFIIVSGTIGEEVAVAAMKAGAHDYVMKGKLARLVPAVERELRDAAVRRARIGAEQERRFQADLLNAVGEAIIATDEQGRITYWNRAAEHLYGWPADQALSKKLDELVFAQPQPLASVPQPALPGPQRGWAGEQIVRRRDGAALTTLTNSAPIHNTDGAVTGTIQVSTDVTKRKLAELELQNSREQLRALAARLQSVREEERKDLSRDIHDELGQVLTGLKMELAWIRSRLRARGAFDRKSLLEKIALLGSQIDATADTIRKLCSELRPGILDDLGLAAAIEWQVREFTKRTGIECNLLNQAEELALDPEASTAVFRIFQEILTNVARHARARKVTVQLERNDARLILEATDDGRGIRPTDLTGTKSLGLLGMRERATALGGTVEFQARQSKGTVVTLSIPLKKPAAASEAQPAVRIRNRRK